MMWLTLPWEGLLSAKTQSDDEGHQTLGTVSYGVAQALFYYTSVPLKQQVTK